MSAEKNKARGFSPEDQEEINLRFALLEKWGLWAGLVVVVLGFGLYVSGLVEPFLPISKLVQFWGLEADGLMDATGIPRGWGWMGYLGYSDILAFSGLVIMILVVLAAYMAILPLLIRKKDTIYVVLVILQIAVFVLAAGNFISVGH